jgi:ABC-type dipeptide/oligopeptide/nickel transport system permease subunit
MGRVFLTRVWVGALLCAGLVTLLSGCGTTGTGLLGGALKGWQDHELRQRPLHSNGLN